ncbi:MAG TPA: secondary thiamine-phosphate synthase enzyme YjbQ [Anaerolineaceae bacterium]|jgi:secondary thiamine-phosphate synthase enzyme|nr:secondary thiamine-phosphate synthase enzyme YjbQ [Anaerolineales bacterium]HOT52708.1 secondary thiamine-phosphate synthase enzyme YjbQ [Anaerolineaceae bacterium]HPY33534.1 secondary thiamine-phosphate synthase enzyme YjbQ [Anaerolineaceae bacterium]HQC21127.1 secondary thiamine-phosphate synthase enzyme YjbQ [Anaerolineaceae bacterium]HQK42751.1 secondary thiamine-phosphate synthase enzyme YjbQ [Anaerolineaceae bacterium]
MFFHKRNSVITNQYNQFIRITEAVISAVKESGIQNGIVAVVSSHTTAGIMVNEALECLESDIDDALRRLIPEDHPYAHARILRSYGSTAGNPTGHLKALLTGSHCLFPVAAGEIVKGEAQEIYFMEFDGPSQRSYTITVQGE